MSRGVLSLLCPAKVIIFSRYIGIGCTSRASYTTTSRRTLHCSVSSEFHIQTGHASAGVFSAAGGSRYSTEVHLGIHCRYPICTHCELAADVDRVATCCLICTRHALMFYDLISISHVCINITWYPTHFSIH